jgi:NADP-dependent 3-hydroxy acid dehydrogenase YdfG
MLQIDVTQPDSIANGVADFLYDHIDTIVANAGVGGENHFGSGDLGADLRNRDKYRDTIWPAILFIVGGE